MELGRALERGIPAGVAAVAASYLYAGLTREFVAAPVSRLLVRNSPDAVVRVAITELGSDAQTLVLGTAILAVVAAFAALGTLGSLVGDHLDHAWMGVPVAGVLAGILGAQLTGSLAVGAVTAVAVSVVLLAFVVPTPFGAVPGAPRRRVLRAAGGVLTAAGIGSVLAPDATSGTAPERASRNSVALDLLRTAESRSLPLAEAEPLVSRDFYEVDVNTINPRVHREDWSLAVTGTGVDASYDFDELRALDVEHRFVTLRCVGDPINGHKMDTALWTGVPVSAVLDDVDAPENCCVMARATDDYYEEFPQEPLREGLLAFAMNGRPLPRGHGAPVRLLVPGHWGEINVKWLTELELLDEPATGYWEKRGWHGTGPVNTVAKIHHTERDGERVSVGGTAYAGTRGVSAVEVSTDGGETWNEAELSARLPGAHSEAGDQRRDTARDAWRHWRYEFTASEEVEVVARAVEADGTIQPEDRENAFPRGASGWAKKKI